MKVAYVTTYDPLDVANWSGLGTYIARSLEHQGIELLFVTIEPNPLFEVSIARIKNLSARLLGMRYLIHRSPAVQRAYARQVSRIIDGAAVEIIFSPGTLPISQMDSHQPIAFWTDATFASMVDFYPEYAPLTRSCIQDGNDCEQAAISRSTLSVYASEWAAQSALSNYQADPGTVKVVPFGANVEWNFTSHEILSFVKAKSRDRCVLLFIGVDWVRKGGRIAVEAAQIIEQMGLTVELHIVGCNPPQPLPEFVQVHGYLSKDRSTDQRRLLKLLQSVHFLILPSRSEAFGLVCAEASSMGVPSITTSVGGIPTVVKNGVNGYCLRKDEPPEKYAAIIKGLHATPEYLALATSTFEEYKARLNWQVAGSQVAALLRSVS